jgi:hypothetical protein
MIFGSHVVLFSTDADADRAFLGTVLGRSAPPCKRSGGVR